MENNWIEICKAGTWTANSGESVTITREKMDEIVGAYKPAEREAPLVFGHPELNHPAFGWATALKRDGDLLLAKFKQVPDAVKKLVADGHYKKVSLALMPDRKTLRHVGLLGAAQPAVPGLKDVAFAAGDAVILEFSTEPARAGNQIAKEGVMPTVAELEKQLADEKAARKAAEKKAADAEAAAGTAQTELAAQKDRQIETTIETRLDDLVEKNRIVPAEKAALKAVALSLGKSGGEIELSEGSGKKQVVEHLFDFLGSLPDRGMLTEFSAPAGGGKDDGVSEDLTGCI